MLAAVVQLSTPGDFAVPGSKYYSVSRPSDYMLTHIARFAKEDTARGLEWRLVLESSLRVRPPPVPISPYSPLHRGVCQ